MPDNSSVGIDMRALRGYRLRRLQAQLLGAGCAGALLLDPVNIRYATGTRNMAVWLMHNLGRYCFVPASGLAVLFEFPHASCVSLSREIETIGEVRLARAHSYLIAGEHFQQAAALWAAEIAELLRNVAGQRSRLAIDRLDPMGFAALAGHGIELVDAQSLVERARVIKSAEEIACMTEALAAANAGMARMRAALKPGITENKLWAELHFANIALGGEWIETRLLSSGPRTNPWYQECSDRVIGAGELISFDTDMVGPHGYCADVSRVFFCGPGQPTNAQRSLYCLAVEQVQHNCALLRPGVSFADLRAHAWTIPERFRAQQYGMIAHGVGMVDEWPYIAYDNTAPFLQQGVLEPGMTLCVESYMGEVGGREGVKVEQQILITDSGHRLLSNFPLEPALLV